MNDDYDDNKPNPFKKEMSTSTSNEEVWLDKNVTNFILNLPREITAITGKYTIRNSTEVGTISKQYRLETYIYKDINYGEKYNSKKMFSEDNILFDDFLNNIKKYFWDKGWAHGDLDPSNYVIYYPKQKPKFKISDFEYTEQYITTTDGNTAGYFKFLWKKDLLNLYYHYTQKRLKNDKWDTNGIITRDGMSKIIYEILNLDNKEKIDVEKFLNFAICYLKSFVYEENVWSNEHWKEKHKECDDMGDCKVKRVLTIKERYDSMKIE